MPAALAVGLLLIVPVGRADDRLPDHEANAVYRALRAEAAGKLPAPTFDDGQTADQQRAALRSLVASDRAVDDFLRDSVTAPFVLKLRDDADGDGTTRAGDLYFAIRADLDAIDPTRLDPSADSGPVEAGNMRFETKLLTADDLKGAGVAEPAATGEWYVHSQGRLLDRIAVESTDRATASRSAESLIVATRTDPRFGRDEKFPNRWQAIDRKAGAGEPRPYGGGRGYAKLTALQDRPGALIVEVHFAFEEPKAWFDGAPILRSKLGLIAQDQIRRLRRELAKGIEPRK